MGLIFDKAKRNDCHRGCSSTAISLDFRSASKCSRTHFAMLSASIHPSIHGSTAENSRLFPHSHPKFSQTKPHLKAAPWAFQRLAHVVDFFHVTIIIWHESRLLRFSVGEHWPVSTERKPAYVMNHTCSRLNKPSGGCWTDCSIKIHMFLRSLQIVLCCGVFFTTRKQPCWCF